MALTLAERNALMERLLSGGLRRPDVKLRERRDTGLTKLVDSSYVVTHEPTDSEFFFNGPISGARGWSGQKRVGTDPSTTWNAESWEQILTHAANWARHVAEWARTPDLWDLDTEPLPDAADNSPFTQAERDEIAKRLDEIHDFVREQFELQDDQLAAIGQTVEELKEAKERVGRKDWKLMLYGAFVSLGLEHAVQPGVVEAVFRLAVEGLGRIFGAGGPPMVTA